MPEQEQKNPDQADDEKEEGKKTEEAPEREPGYPFELSDLNKELEDEWGPGEELDEDDFDELKTEGVSKKPSFPVLTFGFALIKDFVDIVSLGTLGIFLNIIAWIVIRMYLFKKMGFMKRYLYKKYIFTLILEYIPFISMIPQWTIFVLRAHAAEHKKIDQILTSIENLIIKFQKGELK